MCNTVYSKIGVPKTHRMLKRNTVTQLYIGIVIVQILYDKPLPILSF